MISNFVSQKLSLGRSRRAFCFGLGESLQHWPRLLSRFSQRPLKLELSQTKRWVTDWRLWTVLCGDHGKVSWKIEARDWRTKRGVRLTYPSTSAVREGMLMAPAAAGAAMAKPVRAAKATAIMEVFIFSSLG